MAGAPFHNRDGFIWQDGNMIPWQEAGVHILTHGLHYASAVFEGERAYGGKIFKSLEHAERLHASAGLMDFAIPYSVEEIEDAKQAALEVNQLTDAYIRAIAWRGSEMMGVAAQQNTIHLAIAAWEWGDYFADKKKGIRLAMAQWKRPSPETAPSTAKAAGLYMICTLSKHAAEANGFNDALMLDHRGQVAEATGANVFFIKGDEVHTPTPDCFLDGITRRSVIELLLNRGVTVVERAIFPEELPDFEQCFLTGTAAEVTPVAEIDGHKYDVGELTLGVMKDYDDLVRGRKNTA